MELSLRLSQQFANLRRLFVRNTVPANISAFKVDLQDRINLYNKKELTEDPARQVPSLTLQDEDKLTPPFSLFCADGIMLAAQEDTTTSSGKSPSEIKLKYLNAIEEYMFFKEKARIQY